MFVLFVSYLAQQLKCAMVPPKKRRRTSGSQDTSAEITSQATDKVAPRQIRKIHSVYSQPALVNNQTSEHAYNDNGASHAVDVLPPAFVLDYERLAREISKMYKM